MCGNMLERVLLEQTVTDLLCQLSIMDAERAAYKTPPKNHFSATGVCFLVDMHRKQSIVRAIKTL